MASTEEDVLTSLELILQSRKDYYQLLCLLFLEPDQKNMFKLRDHGNFELLREIYAGGDLLENFFETLTMDRLDKEKEEYRRLFIGPGPLAAPPWESYYRSKERLLFEKWTLQVRSLYHQFGLQSRKENNEPDDHLLIELEFMISLVHLSLHEKEIGRLLDNLKSQQEFLENHFLLWIPSFCTKVEEETDSRLYLGAARLLEDFIRFDLTTIVEVREVLMNV